MQPGGTAALSPPEGSSAHTERHVPCIFISARNELVVKPEKKEKTKSKRKRQKDIKSFCSTVSYEVIFYSCELTVSQSCLLCIAFVFEKKKKNPHITKLLPWSSFCLSKGKETFLVYFSAWNIQLSLKVSTVGIQSLDKTSNLEQHRTGSSILGPMP